MRTLNFSKIQKAAQQIQAEHREKETSKAWRQAERELNLEVLAW
jgi:hypothetical protein